MAGVETVFYEWELEKRLQVSLELVRCWRKLLSSELTSCYGTHGCESQARQGPSGTKPRALSQTLVEFSLSVPSVISGTQDLIINI